MAGKGLLAGSMLFVTLCMLIFAVELCLAAYVFNSWANGDEPITGLFATSIVGITVLMFTLLSGAVGLASMIVAAQHGGNQTEGGRQGSLAANMVSLALAALTFCFSCKMIAERRLTGSSKMENIMETIAALNIIVLPFLLMYLASLGFFKSHDNRDVNHNVVGSHTTTRTGVTKELPHHTAVHDRAIAA